MEPIYERMLVLAQPYLDTRRNDLHVQVSYRYILQLLEQVPADKDVVIPAILLHDLGWKMVPEDLQLTAFGPTIQNPELNRRHEVEGVRLARDILHQVNYDPAKTSEILQIIDGHDSRKTALSVNDQVVKDADKLWRFAPEGFFVDHQRFGIEGRTYARWIVQQIDGWFFTDAGKTIARRELEQRKAELGMNGSNGGSTHANPD